MLSQVLVWSYVVVDGFSSVGIVQQDITPFSHLLLLFHRRPLLYHVGRWPSFFTCFFWLSDLHAFFYDDGILYHIYPIIREKCYYLLCIIMEHGTFTCIIITLYTSGQDESTLLLLFCQCGLASNKASQVTFRFSSTPHKTMRSIYYYSPERPYSSTQSLQRARVVALSWGSA